MTTSTHVKHHMHASILIVHDGLSVFLGFFDWVCVFPDRHHLAFFMLDVSFLLNAFISSPHVDEPGRGCSEDFCLTFSGDVMLLFSISPFLAVFSLSLQATEVVVWSLLESPSLPVPVCADVPTCSPVRPVRFVTANSCYSFILFFLAFHLTVSLLVMIMLACGCISSNYISGSMWTLVHLSVPLVYFLQVRVYLFTLLFYQRYSCTMSSCLCFFLDSSAISSSFLVVPFVSTQPGFYHHQKSLSGRRSLLSVQSSEVEAMFALCSLGAEKMMDPSSVSSLTPSNALVAISYNIYVGPIPYPC